MAALVADRAAGRAYEAAYRARMAAAPAEIARFCDTALPEADRAALLAWLRCAPGPTVAWLPTPHSCLLQGTSTTATRLPSACRSCLPFLSRAMRR